MKMLLLLILQWLFSYLFPKLSNIVAVLLERIINFVFKLFGHSFNTEAHLARYQILISFIRFWEACFSTFELAINSFIKYHLAAQRWPAKKLKFYQKRTKIFRYACDINITQYGEDAVTDFTKYPDGLYNTVPFIQTWMYLSFEVLANCFY